MSQSEGAEMAHRLGSSPAAPASPLEYEDLLREILLRLPPLPSSLLRASAVCKRWRGVVTNHRKPPLLGVFEHSGNLVFRSILDPPDRIPAERFDLRRQTGGWSTTSLLACRHGRALLMSLVLDELVVCDLVTGDQHRMDLPPPFNEHDFNGAVLCAAGGGGGDGHVHGNCGASPFKVALVALCGEDNQTTACVYSSETGAWGNLASAPAAISADGHYGILVGNALYWLLQSTSDGILRLDLDGQSLAVIQGPRVTNDFYHGSNQIIQGTIFDGGSDEGGMLHKT